MKNNDEIKSIRTYNYEIKLFMEISVEMKSLFMHNDEMKLYIFGMFRPIRQVRSKQGKVER